MTDVAVRAEGVSKLYRIGAPLDRRSLRETVTDMLSFRGRPGGGEEQDLWALRDVSFEVANGEAVGIIGQNGAGKSTLLKILSRITEPTTGRIELRGRVSSLLEVGTGFHGELSGRENIQLNGAILGMTRVEIRQRFDEIVAFAEVERFIDTPVKYYSSGMYMRLAFAVAAHLEPEILIVDEVLAVGDAAFQSKCLRKMGDVTSHGRTVLFVSHNMPAVKSLCRRAVWLKNGSVVTEGPSEIVVNRYLQQGGPSTGREDVQQFIANIPPDPAFRLRDVQVTQNGQPTSILLDGDETRIEIAFDVLESAPGLHVYYQVLDLEETLVFESVFRGDDAGLTALPAGHYRISGVVPANFLAPRPYEIRVLAGIHQVRRLLPEPVRLAVDVMHENTVNRALPGYVTPARLSPLLPWITHEAPSGSRS
jgi:lipopolysaccharide transport system ATP-binding protein